MPIVFLSTLQPLLYSGKLGNYSVLYAELHSFKTELLMAWMMGVRNVWCESDSLHALQLIFSRQQLCFHKYAAVIVDGIIGSQLVC